MLTTLKVKRSKIRTSPGDVEVEENGDDGDGTGEG